MIAVLLLLAVSALMLPTLTHELYLPAARHGQELAVVCAVALLLVFAVSTHVMLRSGERRIPPDARARSRIWPPWLAVAVLLACGLAVVLVSDWFVGALLPAT